MYSLKDEWKVGWCLQKYESRWMSMNNVKWGKEQVFEKKVGK